MPTTLATLSTDWLGRCAEYRPSAFWFWNSNMNPERMRRVVSEMAAAGIREFLIHPVHGMTIEYLSDEFFERYRFALRLAKEHGLKVWVYDEFGWPSGNAGGLLLRKHPEHIGWYLAFSRDAEGNPVARPTRSSRVLDNTMGAPWTRSEAGYLDTLSPTAVHCFIEMTHERIYRECGELFDEVIAGFFTDEPVCMMDEADERAGGWGAVGMPWTPALPARFRERFGYDIEPRYAELAGDGPSALKRDYWTVVKEMYVEAYHGQIAEWTRAHGVKYTGHVGEDHPLMHPRFSGSVYQCLAEMDEPGIDYLGAGSEPDQRFIDHVLVPSIARHAGRERVYCEAYGITPFDIRLGPMLRRAQMFGIYGIDDIALMGFQQSLDGIRKHTYWPPIFMEAPWWPFYPEYRDALTRSVGLTSKGTRLARYAIMYPQNLVEQVDLFNTDIWSGNDPASAMIRTLALAIYAAGESFEYVFPEVISQATVREGRVTLPHAGYDAILAPSDIPFFEETTAELDRLLASGGDILRLTVDSCADEILARGPSWSDRMTLETDGAPGDIRVFRFDFTDGELVALRNVTDERRSVKVGSTRRLTEWAPESGLLVAHDAIARTIEPHGVLYFSLTETALEAATPAHEWSAVPIAAEWTIAPERMNTARPSRVQFKDRSDWLDAADSSTLRDNHSDRLYGLPAEFRGRTTVPMRAEFECASLPGRLSLLFELGHLESLVVNGTPVDLHAAVPTPLWDESCVAVDIRALAVEGQNTIEGTLRYEEFETSVVNDAFYWSHPMPTCDICLAGDFRYIDGRITAETAAPLTLPLSLGEAGWSEYDGVLSMTAETTIALDLARRIRGLEVELDAEDCVEALLDGRSLGRLIARPYRFDLADVDAGKHTITLRITSTSANILAAPSPWGVRAASWLVED